MVAVAVTESPSIVFAACPAAAPPAISSTEAATAMVLSLFMYISLVCDEAVANAAIS
jgi:hypothetical protein